jgi:hypothetical protein
MVHHSSRHSGRRGAPIRNLTELKKIPGSPHSRRPGMTFGSAQQDVDGRVNSGHDDGGSAMNSLVIARSDSDEAIQPALAARYELDCFASLAMTM